MPGRILMIEDEVVFSDFVGEYFGNHGYEVTVAATGRAGLDALRADVPDAVILDLNLPDMDGMHVCRAIRADLSVPIIILSSIDDETTKVLGLELGADDYATKPFSPRELLARVRAAIRRAEPIPAAAAAEVGRYRIDAKRREVHDGEDTTIELTPLEFDLLWYLVQHPGEALHRERIFEAVWNQEFLGRSRTVDAHLGNLRSKVPDLTITTVRGVGYRFDGG